MQLVADPYYVGIITPSGVVVRGSVICGNGDEGQLMTDILCPSKTCPLTLLAMSVLPTPPTAESLSSL